LEIGTPPRAILPRNSAAQFGGAILQFCGAIL